MSTVIVLWYGYIFSLKYHITLVWTQKRHWDINASWCMEKNLFTPTPFQYCPSQKDRASALLLNLFRLQMTGSTREMSGYLCKRCLASSNICEVLSSSLQLRGAVSQESRLLTCKTANAAKPSALKHVPSLRSFASTTDYIRPKFVVIKAAYSLWGKTPCIT